MKKILHNTTKNKKKKEKETKQKIILHNNNNNRIYSILTLLETQHYHSIQFNHSVRLCSDRHFYSINIRLYVYNILSVHTHKIRNIFLTARKQNS